MNIKAIFQQYNLKLQGANAETIALALYEIEIKRMEMTGGFERCKKVAKKIVKLIY